MILPGEKKQKKFIRFERSHSNSLWQFEISEFDGSRIHMLTFIDNHSQFVLGTMILDRPFKTEDVLELFEKIILMFGKPEAVLSDNGMQWTAMSGDECRFDILCNELGIRHIRGNLTSLQLRERSRDITAALKPKHICQSSAQIWRHIRKLF